MLLSTSFVAYIIEQKASAALLQLQVGFCGSLGSNHCQCSKLSVDGEPLLGPAQATKNKEQCRSRLHVRVGAYACHSTHRSFSTVSDDSFAHFRLCGLRENKLDVDLGNAICFQVHTHVVKCKFQRV